MSLDLFIVPSRVAEVDLAGPIVGLRGTLAPGGFAQAIGPDSALWVAWRVHDEHRGWLEADLERPVPHGTIDLSYRHPDWRALFALVERLATATRGAVYLDGALPWSADELGNPEDLALGVIGTGVPYDRWPALAETLLDAIEAKSGA